MALTIISLRLVIGPGPNTKLSAAIGRQMHCVAQVPFAMQRISARRIFPRSKLTGPVPATHCRPCASGYCSRSLPISSNNRGASFAPAPCRLPNKSRSRCCAKSCSIARRYSSSCFSNIVAWLSFRLIFGATLPCCVGSSSSVHSFSNPCAVNLRVRPFSVTMRTNCSDASKHHPHR